MIGIINRRVFIFSGLLASGLMGQEKSESLPGDLQDETVEFVCPMDPDVRSLQPGKCRRCGMALVPGIPDGDEYRVSVSLRPRSPRHGKKMQLAFTVISPRTGKRVTDFQVVHEKLYHLFIVSQDLQFFLHVHPRKSSGGIFRYEAVFPKPGMYRLLSDFYPQNGTPQLIASTVIVRGGLITAGTELKPDSAPKMAGEMEVSLTVEPQQPIAGMKTLLFFRLNPANGLEQYLGAWGHMLAASSDLVDMMHTHPFLADGGPEVQFNIIFPRAGVYRLWAQFQRKGVVGTAVFTVLVSELK